MCVFCGSGRGRDVDRQAAEELTDVLVRDDVTLVYGGARVGLMCHLADAMLRKGGRVEGVMPRMMVDIERAHPGLHKLHIAADMGERKQIMMRLTDGCLALPGGAGTMDELFDVWTHAYLGTYRAPVGLCNVGGFWDPLVSMLDAQVRSGYLSEKQRSTLYIESSPRSLVTAMAEYRYTDEGKLRDEQAGLLTHENR